MVLFTCVFGTPWDKLLKWKNQKVLLKVFIGTFYSKLLAMKLQQEYAKDDLRLKQLGWDWKSLRLESFKKFFRLL